ncbi:uncharacterized protein LOC134246544 [Saccostrea cucullata]|uniref:uncharacterized protein LOC134246544 n=1 Tax=Saccostrea cuccullata TaxID=36930 RepID=UPI002ED0543F
MGNTTATPEDKAVQDQPKQSKNLPQKGKSNESSSTLSANKQEVHAQSSTHSSRLKCAMCSNLHTLHSHCKQCGNICENCSNFHRKGNAFKDHEVINIALPKGAKAIPFEIESLHEHEFIKSPKPILHESPSGLTPSKPKKKKGMKPESDSYSKQKMKIVLPMVNDIKKIKTEKSIQPEKSVQQVVLKDVFTKTTHIESPSGLKASNFPEKKTKKQESDCTFIQNRNIASPMKTPSIQQEILGSNCSKTSLDDTPSASFKPQEKKGIKRKSDSITLKEMGNAACPKHKTYILDLCCRDCSVAICSQCLVTNHSCHTIGNIEEFFQNKKARIESDLNLIQSHIEQREKAKQKMMEEQEKMEQATGNVVKEIKNITEKMQAIIQQKVEYLKTHTREIKKMVTSRKGDFNKEINKLETLRKKCQDELNTKDLGAVLYRKDKSHSLEDYQMLPSSYKITPATFVHGALDLEIINSFGTIVPATIQEKSNAFDADPMTIPEKKKQAVDNASQLLISTARAPTKQDEEILREAVFPIYMELGKNIL